LSGRGLCDELITRPEESYRLWCVVVCDLETSRIGAPFIYIYIYIYDISILRVNDLTLILLTWRKWWTPNNASKWQMGFNSTFKGLKYWTLCIHFRNFILNSGSEHRPTHTATRKIKWPLYCFWTTFTPSEIGVLLFNVGLWRNTICMRNFNKAYIFWWLVDRGS